MAHGDRIFLFTHLEMLQLLLLSLELNHLSCKGFTRRLASLLQVLYSLFLGPGMLACSE